MNKEDTLILFGRSPYINGIRKYIPQICQKWHTMGVNSFCNVYPQVEYVIFNDKNADVEFTPKHRVIANILRSNITEKNGQKLEKHLNKEFYFCAKKKFFEEDLNQKKLSFFSHTPSMALNWAYLNGFKNVVLIGIDLTPTGHFDKPDFILNWDEKRIKETKEHIEFINGKYLNLYKTNQKNEIDIPFVKIGDLI